MRRTTVIALTIALVLALLSLPATAQPRSPRGQAATQTGAGFAKWVSVDYSRPILRGRTGIFGDGEAYGQKVNAGAPVWRAGADMSTRLKTEVDLVLGGTTLPAGEYSLFIELKSATEWNLIVSNHKAQERYNPDDKEAIWGAYGYDASNDVLRMPMQVGALANSIDELTYVFSDVTEAGGALVLVWENTIGTAPFAVAE
jgi:hypothetical protein